MVKTRFLTLALASTMGLLPGCGADDSQESANDAPACAVGQALCGGECVTLQSDVRHCGMCSGACAPAQVCSLGICSTVCAAGLTPCNGGCADFLTDPSNCGFCGGVCVPGQSCDTGMCTEVAGTTGGTGGATGGTGGTTGGTGGTGGTTGGTGGTGGTTGGTGGGSGGYFSFFITSKEAIAAMTSSDVNATQTSPWGFGGDYGGLAGADAICQQIATNVGQGNKTWKAFLSSSTEDARDRIGQGPWYDPLGNLLALNLTDLLQERPVGESPFANDLPNEYGIALSEYGDCHDIVTGSDSEGRVMGNTCNDWTDGTSTSGPQYGHSFPRTMGGGTSAPDWVSEHANGGCQPSINITTNSTGGNGIGDAGGYGALYCFALTP